MVGAVYRKEIAGYADVHGVEAAARHYTQILGQSSSKLFATDIQDLPCQMAKTAIGT
jgi:hypothetical protein